MNLWEKHALGLSHLAPFPTLADTIVHTPKCDTYSDSRRASHVNEGRPGGGIKTYGYSLLC